ncbi:Elicitor-responsive protein, putative, partial [Perkinsus marinus ATCC 50983]
MSYQYNAVRVEVRHARNLHDTEVFGKMDPYCVVMLGPGKKFKTRVQKDVGSNPTWNETAILQYSMEPEMAFKVMDKESIKDDDFVGSATVSMAAVASSGRWSGDLALYRSKSKPAGSLTVSITMLPEVSPPMMGGAPPVVTATVMGTAPPPPPMMMQQQP